MAGFTYPLALLAVVAVGLMSTVAVETWSLTLKREREAELLFRGMAFQEAIRQYYEKSPGTLKTFPRDLKDLLEDPRTPGLRRYLRRLYRDPVTPDGEWVLIRDKGGGIRGVRSRSEKAPLKRAGFPKGLEHLAQASKYSEWVFEYASAGQKAPTGKR